MPNVPVGAWSAALLPTGKVLVFQAGDQMYVWDPITQQFGAQFAANTNLFCAGLTLLADGRLLAAGGHMGQDAQDNFLGSSAAEIFDPWQETWTRLPDMEGGERWYPTAVTLADGRVLVASGTHAGVLNDAIELLDPVSRQWQIVARQELPLYPWMAVLPDENLLMFGPQRTTGLFDPDTGALRLAGEMGQARFGGAGVLRNADMAEILVLGGGGPPTNSTEIFNASTETWRSVSSMSQPRINPDIVLLPDGAVLVVGGQSVAEEQEGSEGEGQVLVAETLEADATGWSAAGNATYPHGYHSTALLLPDGSVMAGGPENVLERYLPWYFFAGDRPVIESLPGSAGYGETVPLMMTGDAPIDRVVLIRVSSVTHSLNTDQRYLESGFSLVSTGELAVQMPTSAGLAPPGYYLVFIVTEGRVPSEGRFLRIG
ncbi:MAG: galactose oxidase-like domain-containing protein [Gemmatimonadota bacterium]